MNENEPSDFLFASSLKSELNRLSPRPNTWIAIQRGLEGKSTLQKRRLPALPRAALIAGVALLAGSLTAGAATVVYKFVISPTPNPQASSYPTLQNTIWREATAQTISLPDAQRSSQFPLVVSNSLVPASVSRLAVWCPNCPGGQMLGIQLNYLLASGTRVTVVESAAPAPKGGQPVPLTARDPAAVQVTVINGAQTVLYYTDDQHRQVASMNWVTGRGTGVLVFFATPVAPSQAFALPRSMS